MPSTPQTRAPAASTQSTKLTGEQEQALAKTDYARRFRRRQSVYIAYAGAGKTFIILETARQLDDEVLILAFNAAIIRDLQPKLKGMGNRVKGMTSHQFALHSLPADLQRRIKDNLNTYKGEVSTPQIVEALQLENSPRVGNLSAMQMGILAKRTLTRFCQSSDEALTVSHIPNGSHLNREIAETVIHHAQALWNAITSMALPMTHDVYFKQWALSKPVLNMPYRLIDEAQDTNPALFGVLFAQKEGLNIWAGDPYQAIYSWRGAKNAIAMAAERTDAVSSRLTQSFRFGNETAAMATRLLETLGETYPVLGTGTTHVQSAPADILPHDVASKVSSPFAWIAFTNGALIQAAMNCVDYEIPFHIVGQGKDQLAVLRAAMALKRGEIINPAGPLGAYRYWSDIEDEADAHPHGEAARLTRMQQFPGFYKAAESIRKGTPKESGAKVILSTIHAAKGREWDLVVLDKDLDATRDEGDRRLYVTASGSLVFDNPEDIHLRYVAITRARKRLIIACPTLYYWLTK